MKNSSSFILNEIMHLCDVYMHRPYAYSLGYKNSLSKFVYNVNLSASDTYNNKSMYKNGSAIMSEIIDYFCGMKVTYSMLDVNVPLVLYSGKYNQIEIVRDEKNNINAYFFPNND